MPGEAPTDDLSTVLLHVAAESAVERDTSKRRRLARLLRAALEVLEDDDAEAPKSITPEVRTALHGMANSLTVAAEHAEFLAERADIKPSPR
jgi:hypothetical protein